MRFPERSVFIEKSVNRVRAECISQFTYPKATCDNHFALASRVLFPWSRFDNQPQKCVLRKK